MNTVNSLLEKIETAIPLDFGDIFNKSIELFKKVWLQGFVMLLLSMVLMIPFYIIMYLPIIAMGILNPETFNNNAGPELVFLIPFSLFILAFAFFALVIGFGLKSSFYRICKTKDFSETVADDYFYFFKKHYLGKTIKLAAATFGITLLAAFLCVFPIFYVMVPIAFINVIYAFNPELSVSEIINIGFKFGHKKWLLTFGLIIVSALLAEVIGLIMCCIGILVTISFAYIPIYFVYKESVGFNENDVIQEIGTTSE